MQASGRQTTVLYVDHPRACAAVERATRDDPGPPTFLTARTLAGAVDTLEAHDVDCVVAEYELPDGTGIELLDAVREKHPRLPFVLFTATGSEAVAEAATAAGVSRYARKRPTDTDHEESVGDDTAPDENDDGSYERLVDVVTDCLGSVETSVGVGGRHRFTDEVLNTLEDTLCLIDPDGTVRRWNERLVSVTGYDDSEIAEMHALDFFPAEYHDRIGTALENAGTGDDVTVKAECETSDGRRLPYEFTGSGLVGPDGEVTCVVGVGRDITERRQREREIRQQTRAMDEAPVGIILTDPTQPDNPITYANDQFLDITGYDRSEALGRNCRFLQGDDTDPETVAQIRAAVDAAEPVSVALWNYRRDGERFWNELKIAPIRDESGDLVQFVGFQYDATDRRTRELALRDLHDVTRDIVDCRETEAVADRVVTGAVGVLDATTATVYSFERGANQLQSVAASDRSRGSPDRDVIRPGEGPVWSAFVDGETVVVDSDTAVIDGDTAVVVPIGDHGVLVCQWDEATETRRWRTELAGTLAATAAAVSDRIERDNRHRTGREDLLSRVESLTDRVQLTERVQRLSNRVLAADSRSEAHETLCRGLADLDDVAFVWSGDHDSRREELLVRGRSGREKDYLSAVDLATGERSDSATGVPDRSADTTEPSVVAFTESRPVAVDSVADSLRRGDWQAAALSRDYRSVVSVPIGTDGITYGVVSVYATAAERFDADARETLATLGETCGSAIETIDRHRALADGSEVEIAFDVTETETAAVALARQLDARLRIESVVGSHPARLYGRVVGVEADEFDTACEAVPGVESGVVLSADTAVSNVSESAAVSNTGGEHSAVDDVLSVVVTTHSDGLFGGLTAYGGSFRLLVADGETARLTAGFPDAARAREAVRGLTDRFSGVELHARREHDHRETTTSPLEALTDRQREALTTAYHSGYFEWPREQSSDAVAAALGVSDTTFLEHLRRAERRLCRRLLEPEE